MSGGKLPKKDDQKVLTPYQATIDLQEEYLSKHIREDMGSNADKSGIIARMQKLVAGYSGDFPYCACGAFGVMLEVARAHGFKHKCALHAHCRTAWERNYECKRDDPSPGFIVIWGRIGSDRGHAGTVVEVGPKVGNQVGVHDSFTTIEWNVSGDGLNAEGQGVYRLKRSMKPGAWPGYEILGFIDPWGLK